MAFGVGDVVWLKSGGVRMVISHFSDDGSRAKCLWQDETEAGVTPREFVYSTAVLTAEDPNEYETAEEELESSAASLHDAKPHHYS